MKIYIDVAFIRAFRKIQVFARLQRQVHIYLGRATGKIRGGLIFLDLWANPIMSSLSFHLNSNLSRSSRGCHDIPRTFFHFHVFHRSPTVPFHFRIALSLRPRRTIEFNVTIVIDLCVIMANLQLPLFFQRNYLFHVSPFIYPRLIRASTYSRRNLFYIARHITDSIEAFSSNERIR